MAVHPVEIIKILLEADSSITSLVGTRIANKSLYGKTWQVQQAALVISIDGSDHNPNIVPFGRFTIMVEAYENTPDAAFALAHTVLRSLNAQGRQLVVASDSNSYMVYAVSTASSMVDGYDETVEMDVVVARYTLSIFMEGE